MLRLVPKNSPVANGSVWRSPRRWCPSHGCFSLMSRQQDLTRQRVTVWLRCYLQTNSFIRPRCTRHIILRRRHGCATPSLSFLSVLFSPTRCHPSQPSPFSSPSPLKTHLF